jgi:hypothetical protein
MNVGIFGSNKPHELLKKLEHDFRRLQADAGQQTMLYTAFDFFVTGYSLVDWEKKHKALTHKALTQEQVDALYQEMLIKICADLANGSKHFQLTNPPPKTTVTTHGTGPVYEPGIYEPGIYQDDWRAWVELSPSEAAAAGVPARCPVMELAAKVLAYWRRHFGRQP